MEKTTASPAQVGAILNDSHRVLANYRNQHVLAQALNAKSPEPFVVWTLDGDGDPHTGSYCVDMLSAEQKFRERCFPDQYHCPQPVRSESRIELLIEFSEVYTTHRVGRYKDWLIVQPADEMDGQILCYLPSDEWDGASFPDLVYLKEYYTARWKADTFQEAIELIDNYQTYEDAGKYGATPKEIQKAVRTMNHLRSIP